MYVRAGTPTVLLSWRMFHALLRVLAASGERELMDEYGGVPQGRSVEKGAYTGWVVAPSPQTHGRPTE
jgi:hypothetical protein